MKIIFLIPAVLLCCVSSVFAQSTAIVVRHAEKASPTGSPDQDPELSARGRARATALADMLKNAQITAIFATEYKRTQQTAEPLSRALKIDLTVLPASDTAGLLAQVKKTRGNILVVGHSNTVPAILQGLGASEAIEIGDADYDNLFVLTSGTPARLLRLHFPQIVEAAAEP
jgi:broad specificity phosphatase PhoE